MSGAPQLREAGDAALLLQLERVITPDVNARVIAIAAAMRSRDLRGVRDVVSTFHSVAVYFDPLYSDVAAVTAALRDEAATAAPAVTGRRHEIPVAYGGEYGPDLADVAAHAGLTAAEVIDRHAGGDYRVFMLGFQPGFAYLGLVDEAIAAPRRASPRTQVPAGAVGIAGRQTGVYPAVSPGGWQIIGRALEPVFTPGAIEPVRFAPGDTVRFRAAPHIGAPVPMKAGERGRRRRPAPDADASRTITVLRPGLFTTIQTSGQWGRQGWIRSATRAPIWPSETIVARPRWKSRWPVPNCASNRTRSLRSRAPISRLRSAALECPCRLPCGARRGACCVLASG